jgi:hypothetical protein
MDEKVNVPYVVHEADMARMERGNKRLSILASVLVALLFITNGGDRQALRQSVMDIMNKYK